MPDAQEAPGQVPDVLQEAQDAIKVAQDAPEDQGSAPTTAGTTSPSPEHIQPVPDGSTTPQQEMEGRQEHQLGDQVFAADAITKKEDARKAAKQHQAHAQEMASKARKHLPPGAAFACAAVAFAAGAGLALTLVRPRR